MAIFAISDLHLANSINKPMDIFGPRWENYMERLRTGWLESIGQDDTVLVPGDVSWATYIDQILADLDFVEKLPGTKIISKGNHDYWWTTAAKLSRFFAENDLKTLHILHNNSFIVEGTAICGTRGWISPLESGFGADDAKIYSRELQRLELSLNSIEGPHERIIAALHYPPFSPDGSPDANVMAILSRFNVDMCIFGHIHTEETKYPADRTVNGIRYKLVAADHLGFRPVKLF